MWVFACLIMRSSYLGDLDPQGNAGGECVSCRQVGSCLVGCGSNPKEPKSMYIYAQVASRYQRENQTILSVRVNLGISNFRTTSFDAVFVLNVPLSSILCRP